MYVLHLVLIWMAWKEFQLSIVIHTPYFIVLCGLELVLYFNIPWWTRCVKRLELRWRFVKTLKHLQMQCECPPLPQSPFISHWRQVLGCVIHQYRSMCNQVSCQFMLAAGFGGTNQAGTPLKADAIYIGLRRLSAELPCSDIYYGQLDEGGSG